jgi:hypothetical protein
MPTPAEQKLRDVIVALQSDKRALLEERAVVERKCNEAAARVSALTQALEAQRATAARGTAAAAALQLQLDQVQSQRGALTGELHVRSHHPRAARGARRPPPPPHAHTPPHNNGLSSFPP